MQRPTCAPIDAPAAGPSLRTAARAFRFDAAPAARLTLACALLLTLPTGCAWVAGAKRIWEPAPLPAPGAVRGELRVSASPADAVERVVVYLDPLDSPTSSTSAPARVSLQHRARGIGSGPLAVAAGQAVVFENLDGIHHRIFSYSGPNRFDVGVAPGGRSADVSFSRPGAVHFYCALHPDESGVVFVTPSPWFTTADAPGSYRIGEVPPGRYRVVAWGDADSRAVGEVTVSPGASALVDLSVKAR